MKTVKEIRLQHNLTQSAMAAMLQVSRSLLAMAETGERSLPASANIKLQELEINLAASRAVTILPAGNRVTQQDKEQQETVAFAIKKYIHHCRTSLDKAIQKLAGMEKERSLAFDTLAMVAGQRSIVSTDAFYNSWLDAQQATASLKLRRYPQQAVFLQRIKVKSLEAALAAAEGIYKSLHAEKFQEN